MSLQSEGSGPGSTVGKAERSELLTNLLMAGVALVVAVVWWEHVKSFVIFAITLGVLVAIHEWGHFIAAKSVGVHVYEFAIGFGPRLMTYMRRAGTEYTIRAFPIGGFVNPKGMQPDDPITLDGINGRRPAERALVYLAGPLMNIILGVTVLLLSGALFGIPDESKVLVVDVNRKSAAAQMKVEGKNGQPIPNHPPGLRVGDRVLEVNGKKIDSQMALVREIHPNMDKPVTLTVLRGRDTLTLTGVPKRTLDKREKFPTITRVPAGSDLALLPGDQLDQIDGETVWTTETPDVVAREMLQKKAGQPVVLTVWRNGDTQVKLQGTAVPLDLEMQPGKRWFGALGFQPNGGQGERLSLGESVKVGQRMTVGFFRQIFGLFGRPKELGESVGGPIAILATLGQVDRLPLFYYFWILASLSLSLAVFNLLPVPNLDGGHLLLVAVEVIRRRRLEPDTQKAVMLVGLAIMGMLFVYIMTKDVIKHIL